MAAVRYWLVLGTAMSVAVSAGQSPATQPPPPQTAAAADAPDGEFIEFLGADDHGDAAWWEMLKQAPAGSQKPPAPPPKDSNT